jgi:hypothetical protein
VSDEAKPKSSGPLSPLLEEGLILRIARQNQDFTAACVAEEYRRQTGRPLQRQRVVQVLDKADIDRPEKPAPAPGRVLPMTARVDLARNKSNPPEPSPEPAAEPPAPEPVEKPPGFEPGAVVRHCPGPDGAPGVWVRSTSTVASGTLDEIDRELDAMRAVKDAVKGLSPASTRRVVAWAGRVLGT